MATLILIVHLFVCLFLIFIVLIQSSKGAELGAAFGGSSQTLFGARGAATFFSKMTTVAAVVFMLTSFALAIVTNKGASVVKAVPAPAAQKSTIPQGAQGPVSGGQPAQQAPAQPPAAPTPAK